MDTTPLKIDALIAQVKQLAEINAIIEAHTTAIGLMSNSMESMAEAFRELTESITAEPEEADSLNDVLRRIEHTVTLIYARLPAPVKK